MSERLLFKGRVAATADTPAVRQVAIDRLCRTCERLRREHAIQGPKPQKVYDKNTKSVVEAQAVKLPGDYFNTSFLCDKMGTTITDGADVRRRQHGTGINWLDRLNQEFVAQGFLDAAAENRDSVAGFTYSQDGSIELEIEVLTC